MSQSDEDNLIFAQPLYDDEPVGLLLPPMSQRATQFQNPKRARFVFNETPLPKLSVRLAATAKKPKIEDPGDPSLSVDISDSTASTLTPTQELSSV
jgi:hypothetical protein